MSHMIVLMLTGQVESARQATANFPVNIRKYLVRNRAIPTVLLLDHATRFADNHCRLVVQVRVIVHHMKRALMVACRLLQRE